MRIGESFTELEFFAFTKIVFRKIRPNPFFAENFLNHFTQFLRGLLKCESGTHYFLKLFTPPQRHGSSPRDKEKVLVT